MNLVWREASGSDMPLLAEWNHQLIRDEGHRNPMTVPQLAERMSRWLQGDYRAVVFSADAPVAYALFKPEQELVYLRQFFVSRDRRREGHGRAALDILRHQVWPQGVRLTVEVLCSNHAALAFWRSVGYRDYSLLLELLPE